MKKSKVNFLAQAAAIAAIYVVLILLFAPLSYEEILLRGNRYLVPVPPIISNMIIVPFILKYAYMVPLPIPFMMLTVGIGEVISCGILGMILLLALDRYKGSVFRNQN